MKTEVSIVIEWENVILADMGRSINMLEQLRKQIPALGRKVEVIVLFNPEQIERSLLENEVLGRLEPDANNSSFSLRVEEACGKHYYDLKNEGVRLAGGDIVVLLDSDVIPDDGWLANIIKPLYEYELIKLVGGNTYVDFYSLYSKAFALSWFYKLRVQENHGLVRSNLFHANNVAFRKEMIITHPFPELPEGVTRKSCVMLSKQLEREGIPIWINTAAQVSHPAPNGINHFFIRALAQGRDTLLYDNNNMLVVFLTDFYVKKIISSCIKIIINGKKVNLPFWQAPIAMGIMLTYYTMALAGAVITRLKPDYAKASWRI
ncbi:MAG: glycosyltransferase [Thermodesulfobacteriota bacterium]